MSNVIYLVAAYVIVVVGLAIYVLTLHRQRIQVIKELATSPDDTCSVAEPAD